MDHVMRGFLDVDAVTEATVDSESIVRLVGRQGEAEVVVQAN
jgi:uncharacterized protein with FMN-binding domain